MFAENREAVVYVVGAFTLAYVAVCILRNISRMSMTGEYIVTYLYILDLDILVLDMRWVGGIGAGWYGCSCPMK